MAKETMAKDKTEKSQKRSGEGGVHFDAGDFNRKGRPKKAGILKSSSQFERFEFTPNLKCRKLPREI